MSYYTTNPIDRTKISALFALNAARAVIAGFRKKNGEYRRIEGHILPVGDDLTTPYLPVWDEENEGVRRVNIDTISFLEVRGITYRIIG